MAIQDEFDRLSVVADGIATSKAEIFAALTAQGVTVPEDAVLADAAGLIDTLVSGVAPVIGSVTIASATIGEGDAIPEIVVVMTDPGLPAANIVTGWRNALDETVTPSDPGIYTPFATATNAIGSDSVDGSTLTILSNVDAPTLVGTIPAQEFTVGTTETLNAAPYFSGADTYSIATGGTRASVDAAGLVTIDTSTEATAFSVVVEASNLGGSVQSGFLLTVVEDVTAPTPVSGIVIGDTEFTFAAARSAGEYPVNGAWVLDAATINAATPAAAGGQNGQDVNPWDGLVGLASGIDQPWDSRNQDYDAALIQSLPAAMTPGDVFIKSVSSDNLIDMRSADTYIKEFTALNCVSFVPSSTSLRPPTRGGFTTSRANWTTTKVAANMGIFRSQLDVTGATFATHRAGRADRLTRMRSLNNSWMNFWSTLRDAHAGNGLDGYGRDYAYIVGRALMDLHSTDMTLGDKTDLAEGFAQHAIDIFGMMEDGAEWQDNGGWTHGRMVVLLIGGLLLEDQDMLDYVLRPSRALFSEQKTYQYVQAANPAGINGIYVGNGGAVEGSSGERPNYIFIPEGMEGVPHWGIQPYRGLTVNSSHPTPSYSWLNFSTQAAIVLGIDLLDLTGGGLSDDFTPLGAYRQTIDRMTRVKANSVAGEPLADVAYFDPGGGDVTASIYDAGVVDLYMTTTTNRRVLWTGKPEPSLPPTLSVAGTTVTVTFHPWWDTQSSSLALTERAVRWSDDDGETWTTITGISAVAASYDLTGLPATTDVLIQTRCRNSAGWGGWSTNQPNYIQHPVDLANLGPAPAAATAPRGTATTGSASALTAITINEPQIPVYDSDPNNTGLAAITFTGTHDASGAAIRIRIVKAVGGAEVVPWATFTAGSGGVWSTVVSVAPSMDKLVAVVQAVGNAAVTDTQADGWFSGYIVANIGQSLAERPFSLDTALLTGFTATDDKVWIVRNGNTTGSVPALEVVSGGDEAMGLRRLSKVVAQHFDGPLMLIEMTEVGTGEDQWADDSNAGRTWADTGPDALEWVETRGSRPSIAFRNWFTNNAGVQDLFARHFAPFWLKQSIGGLTVTDSGAGAAEYTSGLVNVSTGAAYTANHFMFDLNNSESGNLGIFDPDYTKLVVFFGRSQRWASSNDPLEITDKTNSIPFSDFSPDTNNKQDMFAFGAKRAVEDVPEWQPVSLNSVTGWTGWAAFGGHLARIDSTHVASNHQDGEGLVGAHIGHAIARSLNLLTPEEPEIKSVAWASDGTYCDVSISLPHGGNLSTPRIRQAAGDYTGSFEGDNWVTATLIVGDDGGSIHEVMGFGIIQGGVRTILGFDTAITDTGTGTGAARRGVVRVTPDTPFVDGDGIGYAYGDGAQTITQAGALNGAVYQRRLIETRTHVSGTGYGYPVVATVGEPRKFVASGISGGPPAADFFTLASDTYFQMTNLGTGVSEIAFEARLAVGSLPTVYNYLLAQSASYLGLAVGSAGLLRGVLIKDTNNVVVVPSANASTGATAIDQFDTFKFSVSLGTDPHAKLWVNDALVLDRAVTGAPTEFENSRFFMLFGRPADTLGAGTKVEFAKFWINDSASDGDFSGFGAPSIDLDGAASLASINGLTGTWTKMGGDVT